MASKVEVVFSFDTTGSMYPCLTQVRRNIKNTVQRLFEEIPGIRIGVIAHGDYCDEGDPYITKHLKLTDDVNKIVKFVETVEASGGGDAPECYELVLREAQDHPWTKGATRAFVLIGDEVPHPPSETPDNIDWRKEAKKLAATGVTIYAVQALNRSHATHFYTELARIGGGYHVPLDQFSHITDLVLAVGYRQAGTERLKSYEQEVKTKGRMNRGLGRMFGAMLGRKVEEEYGDADLHAVPPGRFQVLDVDEDVAIKKFVEDNGLAFKKGRGFYEFTKKETIQASKEIILMDRASGDFYAGDKARELLGLPIGETADVRPTDLAKYAVFVQSTSVNRALQKGTRFLYEVDDWDRAGEAPVEDVAEEAPAKKSAAKAAKSAPKPKKAEEPVKASEPAKASAPPKAAPKAKTGRRFEFSDGKSNKFWEVWTEGASLHTQYGRIGSTGQTTMKDFADAAAAQKAAEKLITEKTGKGYVEV